MPLLVLKVFLAPVLIGSATLAAAVIGAIAIEAASLRITRPGAVPEPT